MQHQARKYGNSKFGWDRFINGFLDLMTITFYRSLEKGQCTFFGLVGMMMFFIGFAAAFLFRLR